MPLLGREVTTMDKQDLDVIREKMIFAIRNNLLFGGVTACEVYKCFAEIDRLQAERDAAVEDLKTFRSCPLCAYRDWKQNEEICRTCYSSKSNWQYRGLEGRG